MYLPCLGTKQHAKYSQSNMCIKKNNSTDNSTDNRKNTYLIFYILFQPIKKEYNYINNINYIFSLSSKCYKYKL